MFISEGSTVRLQGCSFSRNDISGSSENKAVVSVNAKSNNYLDGQPQDTILVLLDCTFTGNSGASEAILANSGSDAFPLFSAEVFSDADTVVFWTEIAFLGPARPLEQVPLSRPGIEDSSEWFVNAQQVRP